MSPLDIYQRDMDKFFRAGRVYAVAGASTNRAKFGYKVTQWYKDRSLPVTPINPKKEEILGLQSVQKLGDVVLNGKQLKDVASADGPGVSVSVITPPAVSAELVKEAAGYHGNVKALWFQPGSYTKEIVQQARDAGIETVIADDECILVSGDHLMREAKLWVGEASEQVVLLSCGEQSEQVADRMD